MCRPCHLAQGGAWSCSDWKHTHTFWGYLESKRKPAALLIGTQLRRCSACGGRATKCDAHAHSRGWVCRHSGPPYGRTVGPFAGWAWFKGKFWLGNVSHSWKPGSTLLVGRTSSHAPVSSEAAAASKQEAAGGSCQAGSLKVSLGRTQPRDRRRRRRGRLGLLLPAVASTP